MVEQKNIWGEPGVNEHIVQFYSEKDTLVATLEDYLGRGLKAGDSVVVIAKADTIKSIDKKLTSLNLNLEQARSVGNLIEVDAEDALSRFMDGDVPNAEKFEALVDDLLAQGKYSRRPIRAFGEMVAILWQRGQHEATLELERLWHRQCHLKGFTLLCAYPHDLFGDSHNDSLREICASHARVLN